MNKEQLNDLEVAALKAPSAMKVSKQELTYFEKVVVPKYKVVVKMKQMEERTKAGIHLSPKQQEEIAKSKPSEYSQGVVMSMTDTFEQGSVVQIENGAMGNSVFINNVFYQVFNESYLFADLNKDVDFVD